jgi:hypothetical protein
MALVLLALPLSRTISSRQNAASQLESGASYSDDAVGLRQFLENVLATAKSGDRQNLPL